MTLHNERHQTRPPAWTSASTPFIMPRRRSNVVVLRFGAEAVLLVPESGDLHLLNPTASCVWNACDGRRSSHEVAFFQSTEHDVDFDSALDHVEQTIARFAAAGLLDGRDLLRDPHALSDDP